MRTNAAITITASGSVSNIERINSYFTRENLIGSLGVIYYNCHHIAGEAAIRLSYNNLKWFGNIGGFRKTI